MARWRKDQDPDRLEPPAWYRTFDPAAWDEPDEHETRMLAGSHCPWPDDLHLYHAERRWHEAQHAYRQAHAEFAEQEFQDLLDRVQARRET